MHAAVARAGRLALLLPVLLSASCGDDPVDPRVEAILPDHGQPGDQVDVVGERFAGTERQVSFGGAPVQVTQWHEGRVRVVVPALAAGLTLVVVTIDGRPSNPVNFRIE